jgi:formamidopyrimidine-DNA glycosylase
MPEIPDLETYLHALRPRIVGRALERVRISSPFLLRSVEPPLATTCGLQIRSVSRLGKRIVIGLDREILLVIHLMIAGRLQWKRAGAKIPRRSGLAAFDVDGGTLILTEAGSKKRASLHLIAGKRQLSGHDPGGIEPIESTLEAFTAALESAPHTLKRALTDPTIFSGIGNAYSDEILLRAGLSPFKRTTTLSAREARRLHRATHDVLSEWTDRLISEAGDRFPTKVRAFRPEMAVHGRYGKECPACGSPVQRIIYAERESNYCPGCQTGGKILADRVLSKLLKEDWPRTLEELERRRALG